MVSAFNLGRNWGGEREVPAVLGGWWSYKISAWAILIPGLALVSTSSSVNILNIADTNHALGYRQSSNEGGSQEDWTWYILKTSFGFIND